MKKRTLYWVLAALFAAAAIYTPFDHNGYGVGVTIVTVVILAALAVAMACLAQRTDADARLNRKSGRLSADSLPGDYVCFDLETTGLLNQDPRIIELGAVRVRGGKVTGSYGQLVNPEKHIPAKVSGITGLTDMDVASSPTIAQALPGFLEFCGNDILVGHNINRFDVPVIQEEAKRAGIALRQYRTIDTLPLAQRLCPELQRHRVVDLIQAFGIASAESHRAVDDATQTAQIYEELRKRA